MRARLVSPEVEREPVGRPERCEGCGGAAFVKFGRVGCPLGGVFGT
jgi:hypothetical protein